jgi:hypothetical protein
MGRIDKRGVAANPIGLKKEACVKEKAAKSADFSRIFAKNREKRGKKSAGFQSAFIFKSKSPRGQRDSSRKSPERRAAR